MHSPRHKKATTREKEREKGEAKEKKVREEKRERKEKESREKREEKKRYRILEYETNVHLSQELRGGFI